jgi:hypothetical protein
MNERTVIACKVEMPDGLKDVFTLLPWQTVRTQGLIPEAVLGMSLRPLREGEPLTPDNFADNKAFIEFLHGFIAQEAPSLPGLQAEARRQQEGWVYLLDARIQEPAGEVPPEDILGAFEVKGGEVVAGSYQMSTRHALFSRSGFFRLDPELHRRLVEELVRRSAAAQDSEGSQGTPTEGNSQEA